MIAFVAISNIFIYYLYVFVRAVFIAGTHTIIVLCIVLKWIWEIMKCCERNTLF